jgi:hypothetical protein
MKPMEPMHTNANECEPMQKNANKCKELENCTESRSGGYVFCLGKEKTLEAPFKIYFAHEVSKPNDVDVHCNGQPRNAKAQFQRLPMASQLEMTTHTYASTNVAPATIQHM